MKAIMKGMDFLIVFCVFCCFDRAKLLLQTFILQIKSFMF